MGSDAAVTLAFAGVAPISLTIREGSGVDLNPNGVPINPVVTWVSGVVDVLMECVT